MVRRRAKGRRGLWWGRGEVRLVHAGRRGEAKRQAGDARSVCETERWRRAIRTARVASANNAMPAGWDLFSKSGTMFIGERLWNKVSWGKTKTGDTSQRSLAKVRPRARMTSSARYWRGD